MTAHSPRGDAWPRQGPLSLASVAAFCRVGDRVTVSPGAGAGIQGRRVPECGKEQDR